MKTDKMKREQNNNDLLYYVSYGSNMLYERFMHYIRGGSFSGGGACHAPCADQSEPREVITVDIPYDMYYRGSFKAWGGKGVSFLDITKPGHAYGVAYLITREQFIHVSREENGGREPEDCPAGYNAVFQLEPIGGHEVWTISNYKTENFNDPSDAYLDTLKRGMLEHYPGMSEEEIDEYLGKCKRSN